KRWKPRLPGRRPPRKRSTLRLRAAMQCCERSKRPPNNGNLVSIKAPSPASEGEFLSHHSGRNGKVCRLQQQAASIPAAGAAAHHYIRIFLLACKPGPLAILQTRRRVRTEYRIRRTGKLPVAVRRSQLLQIDADDDRVLVAGRRI